MDPKMLFWSTGAKAKEIVENETFQRKPSQVNEPSCNRNDTKDYFRGPTIKRKRTYYEMSRSEINNECIVQQDLSSSNSHHQAIPVLDLEEMTSWGVSKKKIIPKVCLSSNSCQQNSSSLDLVSSKFNEENFVAQPSNNYFEETFIGSSLFDVVEIEVPYSLGSNNTSEHTPPLLDLGENVIPQDSTYSLEKLPPLLDLEKILVPQASDSIDLAQFDFQTIIENYLNPFESMVWENSGNSHGSETSSVRGVADDCADAEDNSPFYSEEEIYKNKKHGPKIMWSGPQIRFIEEYNRLYCRELQRLRNRRRQRIVAFS